mmetsp:Transcript_21961/g.43580  ORF Transcript_21961/g.43580 Transcript_21961/m.43580 type:complete len:110 (+) Transcript_21961:1707-2036(+)
MVPMFKWGFERSNASRANPLQETKREGGGALLLLLLGLEALREEQSGHLRAPLPVATLRVRGRGNIFRWCADCLVWEKTLQSKGGGKTFLYLLWVQDLEVLLRLFRLSS